MDILFYTISVFLIILLPIIIRIEGTASYERRLVFLTLKVYGVRILLIILYIDQEGELFISMNRKKAKQIMRNDKISKKKVNLNAFLTGIYLTKADVSLYVGGPPQRISLIMGAVQLILEYLILSANDRFPIEFCRIRALPCYVNEQFSANFSISIFTSPVLMLVALLHTKKGEKDAKRSNRKYDGENNLGSQAND